MKETKEGSWEWRDRKLDRLRKRMRNRERGSKRKKYE